MDFQNRAGSKPGSGGVASAQQSAMDRRERLRQLAMETIDLKKDPYFMKNHVGTFECKLCQTLHKTEGNYLAHTQGKKHQTNLARRAARDAKLAENAMPMASTSASEVKVKKTVKIGRPGYRVTKKVDDVTGQKSLAFTIDYAEIEQGLQPRYRFMSAFEQKQERPDKNFRYLLFGADPYETIAFKIPNLKLDMSEGKFSTNWDRDTLTYTLQLHFNEEAAG